jgi:hypothetical protein
VLFLFFINYFLTQDVKVEYNFKPRLLDFFNFNT